MHLSSLEVRWFWPGGVDSHPDLKKAFESATPIKGLPEAGVKWAKPRTDVYLVVPTADDLGIKWREGELQTKGRRAVLGRVIFAKGVAGLLEQWTKWTHEGPRVDALVKQLFSSANGAAVSLVKHRALRKIRLDPTGSVEEVPPSDFIDRGVNYELTDLRIDGLTATSLAFEAFPDDSEMPEQLNGLVARFVEGFQASRFDEAVSESYPAWLMRLATANGAPGH